jgi:hypothetical protein
MATTYTTEQILNLLIEVERNDQYHLSRPTGDIERKWAAIVKQLLAQDAEATRVIRNYGDRVGWLETQLIASQQDYRKAVLENESLQMKMDVITNTDRHKTAAKMLDDLLADARGNDFRARVLALMRNKADSYNLEAQNPRADLKNLIGVRARAKADAMAELEKALSQL